jgi:N-methylhydantoinase A
VDPEGLQILAGLLMGNYEAVAICLLHSYRNPRHEQAVRGVIEASCPGMLCVCSHEIAPVWREFERWTTTVVSAFVAPDFGKYLRKLNETLTGGGFAGILHIMQSNGGTVTMRSAANRAVHTLLSGPAGGTRACVDIGRTLGVGDLVAVDMGGTSFDVSLVVAGEADVDNEITVDGHPLLTPSVRIHSLGAGGGSIAYVEAGGLRVGPQSAGASPGPACYSRGGVRPTVTDANLLLGRIPGGALLGGHLPLDKSLAASALGGAGSELGLSEVEFASALLGVTDATMADAIREVAVARGVDVRGYSLVAFGGAGPLHAVALAEELGMRRVIVPPNPGVLSAWGMLNAPVRIDLVQAFYHRLDGLAISRLLDEVEALERGARAALAAEGVETCHMESVVSAELRYVGQEFTLGVPLVSSEVVTCESLTGSFAAAHDERYGHRNPGEAVEIVNIRATGLGIRERAEIAMLQSGPMPLPREVEQTYFRGGGCYTPTPVYWRPDLPRGASLPGPAIVLESGCTTLIPEPWSALVSERGHLILEVEHA